MKIISVVINDWDKAIASFWRSVTKESDRFIDKIWSTPFTIKEWKRQKIYENSLNKCSFDLGFATFYLNRTNRSGIIKGGVIGNLEQTGQWGIYARFNKENLIHRIEFIKEHRKDIYVYNKVGLSFIENYVLKYENNGFVYFDPLYFSKRK